MDFDLVATFYRGVKIMSINWTYDLVTSLRQLRNQGLSVNQCARTLGLTRGQVLGKLSRLGLCNSSSTAKRIPHRPATRPQQQHTRIIAETIPPADEIPLSQRLTLTELTICSCRWPYGDPLRGGFFFCGSSQADIIHGKPYCPVHDARAWAVASSSASTIVL